jgi:hypothetical protein
MRVESRLELHKGKEENRKKEEKQTTKTFTRAVKNVR